MDDFLENMNRMATDILECPKCDCECLELTDADYDPVADVGTESWLCLKCGHSFENQN